MTTQRKTIQDLLATPDDGYRYELVRGEILRMPAPKGEHGTIEAALVEAIGTFRTARVHLSSGASFQVPADGALEGSEVLPGFAVALTDLFP